MYSAELTLREALAVGLLELFVRQEEGRGSELNHGSELERALALLITQRRLSALIPKGRIALLVRKRSQSPSRLSSGRACGHRSQPSQADGNPVLFGTSRMTVIAASVERKERQIQVLRCGHC